MAKGQTIYVIVDGLSSIPDEWKYIRDVILGMIPFGYKTFRFLLTGDAQTIFSDNAHKYQWKSYPVDPFGFHETSQYLANLSLDRDRLSEIHRVTDGIPARLASVKRILSAGKDTQQIIEECDASLNDFFDLEWKSARLGKGLQCRRALAMLAFDDRFWGIRDIARLLNVDQALLAPELRQLSFVSVDEQGNAQYISDAFRQYAQTQLADEREVILDLIIKDLASNPTSEDTLISLPSLLERAGRENEMMACLSVENLDRLLAISKTLATVYKNLDLGIAVSHRSRSDENYFTFTSIRSLLSDLWTIDAWKDEVDALLSLGKFDKAASLATAALLTEDQLQLFCLLARWQKQRGETPDKLLIERIHEQYKKLDPKALGYEKAIDIAGDLFQISPDLAIELVTRSIGEDDKEHSLDWALVRLSISATNRVESRRGVRDTLEVLRSKITNTKAKNVFSFASALAGSSGANEVIEESGRLERTSDRMMLLRQWIVENRTHASVGKVIQHAIDIAIAETEFSPNAAFYRDISYGLIGIQEATQLHNIVNLLDGQRTIALQKGPTADYVRFQLNVAAAEFLQNQSSAASRCESVYLDPIYGLSDPTVKGLCLAWFLAAITKSDPEKILEANGGFHSLAQAELDVCITQILNTTAEHYQVTRGILEPLALVLPDLAIKIAQSLNIQDRRDAALADVIKTIAEHGLSTVEIARKMSEILSGIELAGARDSAILALVAGVGEQLDRVPELSECLPKLRIAIQTISSLSDKCTALVKMYRCVSKSSCPPNAGTTDDIASEIKASWEAISSPWEKISIAFEIASGLAAVAPAVAEHYAAIADTVRHSVAVQTVGAADAVRHSMHLLLLAVQGLIANDAYSSKENELVEWALRQAPSPEDRAVHWANVACSYHLKGNDTEVKKIVISKVLPALDEINPIDISSRTSAVITVAPALWFAQREICAERITKLTSAERDSARWGICKFIFQKTQPGYPYEPDRRPKYAVNFAEIMDIISILRDIEDDGYIHLIVSKISETVVHKKTQYTRDQAGQIATHLTAAIHGKLPNIKQIKHLGYQILCNGHIARIKNERSKQFWLDRIAEAEQIPNLADSAFVLAELAKILPPNLRVEKLDWRYHQKVCK